VVRTIEDFWATLDLALLIAITVDATGVQEPE
jgi:hypothetical protein